MRMRHKPNLEKRMANCSEINIPDPENFRGRWTDGTGYTGLYLEIGCGKGSFTAGLAATIPEIMLVAIEKVPDAMVMAMEKCISGGLNNVRFIDGDAANLGTIFAGDEVNRIYINFCDPWPKSRDAKLRLTAPGFLRSYASVLPIGGEIRFRTDNLPLFNWSLEQFGLEGWRLEDVSNDTHSEIMTDYESKFTSQGIKINSLTAVRTADTKTTAAGVPERLRNASLSDARGNQ